MKLAFESTFRTREKATLGSRKEYCPIAVFVRLQCPRDKDILSRQQFGDTHQTPSQGEH
jgi:hypothetical protein